MSKDDVRNTDVIDKLKRKQKVNIINESGLYCLIFSSRLSAAKDFKKWVTSEVLPAIRKYGRYDPDGTLTYGKERYQSQSIPLFLADDFFFILQNLRSVILYTFINVFYYIFASFTRTWQPMTIYSPVFTIIAIF